MPSSAVNWNASGVATLSSVSSLSGINAGTYPTYLRADYAGGVSPTTDASFGENALTVNQALASVTGNNKSRAYGDSNPALDAAVTGTIGADTLNYSLATIATTSSGAGTYPITVTLGSNPNYIVTPTDGTLTVNPAVLTVTADSVSRPYGSSNPTFTASYTGFKNSEILGTSGVSGAPSLTTGAI